jgi:hypothetical protein
MRHERNVNTYIEGECQMNSAMKADVRALGTASHYGREVSFEEAWADTFDQAVTRGEAEPFEAWCDWFGVSVIKVHTETDIGMGLLAFCPFFRSKTYRDDAVYEVGCMLHGSEEAYLDFIASVGR